MTTQVTQCPNCNTSFRVTDSQLAIANGAVRCGSCLHIFDAADHWLSTQQPAQPEAAPEATIETPDDPAELSNLGLEESFDDLLIDESNDQDSLETIFEDGDFANEDYLDELANKLLDESTNDDINTTFSDDVLSTDDDLFEIEIEEDSSDDEEGLDQVNIDDYILSDDEQLIDDNLLSGATKAESIINTDNDLESIDNEPTENDDKTNSEYSPVFLELDYEETQPAAVFKELDDIGEETNTDEESWARKLLDEDEKVENTGADSDLSADDESDEEIEVFFDALDDDEPQQPEVDKELLDILSDHENDNNLPNQQDEFILSEGPLSSGERIGEDKSALLANIEPEPVELAAPSQGNQWLKRLTSLGIAAAMLLLAAQYIHFNFDRLARDENYRPALAKLCNLLTCQLPAMDDVTLIRSSNLIVRSHPTIEKALVVDAIMTNHARFVQPFPIMELQFTDLNGNVIAGRQFLPTEYLAGELLGKKLIPMRQPVHIAIEIVDPGEQAVNYQMRFHPAKKT